MGKWESTLEKVLKYSADSKKSADDKMGRCQTAVDAAHAFISAHGKSAPKVAKAMSELIDASEDCGRAVAELSVYEDEYEQAKKDKVKAQIKKLEAKMKPLEEAFENGRKEVHKAADDVNKAYDEIMKLVDPLKAALG
jgi:hypothetical protein